MERKVHFMSEGLKLCGILSEPAQRSDRCVILCHGITVDKNEGGVFTELANKLTAADISSFRFDFRGHGESEGDSVDMTIAGEKRDIEAAVAFLQKNGYERFAFVAASFGGGPTALFVAGHEGIVKAVVLWNSMIDYGGWIRPTLPWPKKYFGLESAHEMKKHGFVKIGSNGLKVGPVLFAELRRLKPWKALYQLKIPILFVHGDKDTKVPYKDSVKYSKMFKAQLVTIKGGEHGFHESKAKAEQADAATIEFLAKHL